jgi:hypothetical protein
MGVLNFFFLLFESIFEIHQIIKYFKLIYISINLNYKYTFIFVKKTFGYSKPNLKTLLA